MNCKNYFPTSAINNGCVDDCINFKSKQPEFEVGDWFIRSGLIGCSDNFPFQFKNSDYCYTNLVDEFFINGWMVQPATDQDWWFERNGVKVMMHYIAEDCIYAIIGDMTIIFPPNQGKLLAKALDIPIKPYGWIPKGE